LVFWVKDTGIGMKKDELENIFKWFIKGQKASEQFYQGAGLGLTITKLIVELMNGRIWVESEESRGSCFFVTLPAVPSQTSRMVH
jgi:signal transduction histidine kinase